MYLKKPDLCNNPVFYFNRNILLLQLPEPGEKKPIRCKATNTVEKILPYHFFGIAMTG